MKLKRGVVVRPDNKEWEGKEKHIWHQKLKRLWEKRYEELEDEYQEGSNSGRREYDKGNW